MGSRINPGYKFMDDLNNGQSRVQYAPVTNYEFDGSNITGISQEQPQQSEIWDILKQGDNYYRTKRQQQPTPQFSSPMGAPNVGPQFRSPMGEPNVGPQLPREEEPDGIFDSDMMTSNFLDKNQDLEKAPQPDIQPMPQVEPDMLERFKQTTLGQSAGKDPRLLMAAMSQFAGEAGNIGGKPTKSTAMDFYGALKEQEKSDFDMGLKQKALDIKAMPKAASADILKQELMRAQRDATIDKTKLNAELADPTSERSKALRKAFQGWMLGMTGKEVPMLETISGHEVLKFLQPAMGSLGLMGQMQRADMQSEFDAQKLREQQEQAEKDRLSREAIANKKLEAQNARDAKNKNIDSEKAQQGRFKISSKLREEYTKNQITKNTISFKDAYGKIINSLREATGPGDMAAIYKFNNLLDPGTAVKEGEFANAKSTTGAFDKILNWKNQVENGTMLNPRQRKDFLSIAKILYEAQMKDQQKLNKQYTDLAIKNNIDPKDLMIFGEGEVGSGVGEQKQKIKSVNDLPSLK